MAAVSLELLKPSLPSQHPFTRPRRKSLYIYCFQPEEQLKKESKNANAKEKVFPFWIKAQRSLVRRIVELTKRRQLAAVFELLENAINENIKLNRVVMNSALAACVHCGNVDQAFLMYHDMLRPGGCGVDAVTYTILLKGLGESRMFDEAFELVESIESGNAPGRPVLSEVHIRTLLNAFAEAGEMLRARGVLTRYRSLVNRTGPSIFTYNILIKAYTRSNSPLEALKLIDDINRLGLQPQRITYNSLILACVRGGDLSRALQLLREMKREAQRFESCELLPDIVTYSTLIQGFGQQGLFDGVTHLVKELKASRHCALDRVAYGVIIDAYISAGSSSGMDEGLYLLKEMMEHAKKNPELRPKAHVFLSLMRALAVNGNVHTIKMLQDEMIPAASGPVLPEYRSEADELLIEAAVNDGQLGLAKRLLNSMRGLKKGIPLSSRAYLVVVRLLFFSDFGYNMFSPFVLQEGVALDDPVEKWMYKIEDAKPPLMSVRLSEVVMRFFAEAIVPVVDDSGKCVGAVHREDCFELNATLGSVMRAPPIFVSTPTPVAKALTLLLEAEVKMVAILEIKANYVFAKDVDDKPVGFLTLERLLSFKVSYPSVLMNRTKESLIEATRKLKQMDVT